MLDVTVGFAGPLDAKVLIVGEAPGKEEIEQGRPFVGQAGIELTRQLHETGFIRAECRIGNVCQHRPPNNKIEYYFGKKKDGLPYLNGRYVDPKIISGVKRLEEEIDRLKPKLILAFGSSALWALTGNEGITNWRGSILSSRPIKGQTYTVIPTFHPSAVLRDWDLRFTVIQDLKRAQAFLRDEISPPKYQFTLVPSLSEVHDTLTRLTERLADGPLHISIDIETQHRHMACVAFAWSATEAICIPFMDLRKSDNCYWSFDEEAEIRSQLISFLTHPNLRISGQNFVYDAQYFAREFQLFLKIWRDAMTTHHVYFAGLPNSLAYQSSLYLDWHEYWKGEGKELPKDADQFKYWQYNCKDACITWAIVEEQEKLEPKFKMRSTEWGSPLDIQRSLHEPVFEMMLRGVRIDTNRKREFILEIEEQIVKRESWLAEVVGRPINPRSPKQLIEFFYNELGLQPIINHKTKKPSCDENALNKIASREPGLRPIVEFIQETRQLSNARAFCLQPLDVDSRIRCSYNTSGTETYRFASSEDAFGFGTNLQNVTEGYSDPLTGFHIPNLRRLFIPDPGYMIGDFDLSAADAQVVAADAGDWELLELFQTGADLHTGNAKRWGVDRPVAKGCLHATNYGATAYSLQMNFGIPKAKAEFIIEDWLNQRPKIREWHNRIKMELQTRRYVENAFGYRRYYFGRIEDLLKEALAWIPQSTVAIVTNLGIRNVYRNLRHVHPLLQVHDSAIYQWHVTRTTTPDDIIELMKIPVPYAQPLIIGVGCKVSEKSWGDCVKRG